MGVRSVARRDVWRQGSTREAILDGWFSGIGRAPNIVLMLLYGVGWMIQASASELPCG
jgi:hypothetical protein